MWMIYKHTNKINGKSYIGQTIKSIDERAGRDGKNYEGSNEFCSAIKEYGWDNFEHTILQENIATQEEADTQERYWIKYYDTFKHGYNLTLGGSRARFTLFKTREYKKQLKTIEISEEFYTYIREYAEEHDRLQCVSNFKEYVYGNPDKRTVFAYEDNREGKLMMSLNTVEALGILFRDGKMDEHSKPFFVCEHPNWKSYMAYQVVLYCKLNNSHLSGCELSESISGNCLL